MIDFAAMGVKLSLPPSPPPPQLAVNQSVCTWAAKKVNATAESDDYKKAIEVAANLFSYNLMTNLLQWACLLPGDCR